MSDALLLRLQEGLPLVSQPFAKLGEALGLTEAKVLELVQNWCQSGLIRRLGAIYDPRRIGLGSVLIAFDGTQNHEENLIQSLIHNPGVTHCYRREVQSVGLAATWKTRVPSLWATFTAPQNRLNHDLAALQNTCGNGILSFPVVRSFKIGVVLDPASGQARSISSKIAAPPTPIVWDSLGLALRTRLEEGLPLVSRPFLALAEELHCDEQQVISRLESWQQAGALRRLAAVLDQNRAGLSLGGMCVFQVADTEIESIGQRLAGSNLVTHCYHRQAHPFFPFQMYAMVHAADQEHVRMQYQSLSSIVGHEGLLLCSTHQYKKSSLKPSLLETHP